MHAHSRKRHGARRDTSDPPHQTHLFITRRSTKQSSSNITHGHLPRRSLMEFWTADVEKWDVGFCIENQEHVRTIGTITNHKRQAWKVTSFVTDTNLNCTRWIFCLREANFWQKNIETICTTQIQYHPSKYHFLIYKPMPDHEGVWEYSYYSVLFSILWLQHEF